jgi:hypothetical protein
MKYLAYLPKHKARGEDENLGSYMYKFNVAEIYTCAKHAQSVSLICILIELYLFPLS